MFTFSVVKKIGKGNYFDDGLFIIERARRERALNIQMGKIGNNKARPKSFTRNG